jgi:NAD(P)-dependent dehydrogenase (short-subunit alcohol dehydrogenase family)
MSKTVLTRESGLGYQTAQALALRGCRVILARVGDLHQNKLKRVNSKTLDLSSLRSVREFASDVIKTEDRLDILIITSGTSVESDGATRDGLHPVMQANYFGPFLLTHLLAGTLYLEHLWNITLVTISGVPLALSQKLHLLCCAAFLTTRSKCPEQGFTNFRFAEEIGPKQNRLCHFFSGTF